MKNKMAKEKLVQSKDDTLYVTLSVILYKLMMHLYQNDM